MSLRLSVARLAAAVLTTAAAGLVGVVVAAPSQAATCSSGSGVSVVVDFGSLGGGVGSGCVGDGAGKSARSLFASAGFSLEGVQGQAAFVCRIEGLPSRDVEACNNTPPENAYWALWWSDGTSGDWLYSNYGVDSLKVPQGAYVGFAWQSGSRRAPGLSPAAHAAPPAATPTTAAPSAKPSGKPKPSSSPSSKPSTKPSAQPSNQPSSQPSSQPSAQASSAAPATPLPTSASSADPTEPPSADASASASTPAASASPSAVPSAPETASPGETLTLSVSGSPSADAPVTATDAVSQSDGLPVWVVPAVLLVLAAGGAATYLVRRRDRPRP